MIAALGRPEFRGRSSTGSSIWGWWGWGEEREYCPRYEAGELIATFFMGGWEIGNRKWPPPLASPGWKSLGHADI